MNPSATGKFLLADMPDKLSCFDSLWENFFSLSLKYQTREHPVWDVNTKPLLWSSRLPLLPQPAPSWRGKLGEQHPALLSFSAEGFRLGKNDVY